MLTQEERRMILEEGSHYPQRRACLPEALKIAQRRKGWLDEHDIRDVACLLEMTPEEVDALATFYSLIFRRPVGRHVILLCDGVSCHVTGSDLLRGHLRNRLGAGWGQTTADGRFTLLPCACLGLCEQAPAMMIDQDVHGNLAPQMVDQILAKYP
jgi:NADH-quinone oxidoreductase subunit E